MPNPTDARPLDGVTIAEIIGPDAPVDLSISASLCGRIALDMGAKVIRLTSSACAQINPAVDLFLNTQKQIITVAGDSFAAEARKLSAKVDGLIADVGTRQQLADGPAAHAVVELGMAIDDPLGGTEFTVAARAGLLDLVGDPDRQPLRIGGHQLPFAAGLACYAALLDALTSDKARNAGQLRRVDLLDIAVWLNWKTIGASSIGLPVPTRKGDKGMWCVVPCKDGFLALVYRSTDWQKLIDVLADDRLADPKFATDPKRRENLAELNAIFGECFAHLTRAEIRQISLEQKLPLGAVSSLEELVQDEHMKTREFFQPVTTPKGPVPAPTLPVRWNGRKIAARAHADGDPSALKRIKPFANCRVLDLGIITAGAATSAILADLGADVIKIEGPANPDPFRFWDGPLPEGSEPNVPPYFRMTNRGKRNLLLDLKGPDGRQMFLDMVKTSDVVVENFRRGVLDGWGLSYEDLRQANPNIILASISSQGETGPDSRYVSFGNTLEAMGGLASITGYEGGPPVVTGADFNYPDQVVAIFAASMIQTAWLAKERGSGGAHLDLSQRELTSFLCGDAMISGSARRMGNAQAGMHVQDCFTSADGDWIAVSIYPHDLDALAQVGCTGDHAQVGQWVAARSTQEVLSELRAQGISAAKVLNGLGVLSQRTGSWSRAMSLGQDGELVKGVLFDSLDPPASLARPAAQAGAASAEILAEFTGLSGASLGELLERVGARAQKPVPLT